MNLLKQGESPGGQRHSLIELLPLRTPILLQFFPVYACNFKCDYCLFSIVKKERYFISEVEFMSMSLFDKVLKDLSGFKDKIKVVRFVGMGEPFLNNNLLKMVKDVEKYCDKTEVITNGSLITKQKSDEIIESGLDSLIISIQGVTEESYKTISEYNIDFENFVNNIKYLYNNKTNLKIYIKTVDIALKKDEDKIFYDIFGKICDTINIETASPIYPEVKLNESLNNNNKNQFNNKIQDVKICPQPFYTLQINPDGFVVPCYSCLYPEILGNAYCENIVDIWNKNYFRQTMIKEKKQNIKVCKDCNICNYRVFDEDLIDDYEEKLTEIYEEIRS
jgi:radical SAM protein with 4Fe4S-binding SPASM domain